ncbi:MAG: flagellar hook capping FlgD N-terminal domain-containing protein [Myxococcota bacterium]
MEINTSAGLTGATAGTIPLANPDESFDREAFLRLLVTQLTHQDPLAPSDPTEFVSQLAQFSSLEQLVGVNGNIEVLALSQSSATSAQMVSFVGKDVVFDSDKLVLGNNGQKQPIYFRLGEPATSMTIQVKDSGGKVVRTITEESHPAGEGQLTFDGLDDQKNPLPAGTYSITVSATNGAGDSVDVSTRSRARIAGITFKNGYPELLTNDTPPRTIALANVLEVHEPTEPSATTESVPTR